MIDLDDPPEDKSVVSTRLTIDLVAITLLIALAVAGGCLIWSWVMIDRADRLTERATADRVAAEQTAEGFRRERDDARTQTRCERAQGAGFALILFNILDVMSGYDEAQLKGLSTDALVAQFAEARKPLIDAKEAGALTVVECSD